MYKKGVPRTPLVYATLLRALRGQSRCIEHGHGGPLFIHQAGPTHHSAACQAPSGPLSRQHGMAYKLAPPTLVVPARPTPQRRPTLDKHSPGEAHWGCPRSACNHGTYPHPGPPRTHPVNTRQGTPTPKIREPRIDGVRYGFWPEAPGVGAVWGPGPLNP